MKTREELEQAVEVARAAMDAAWDAGKGCRTTKCDEWQAIKDTRKVWIAAAKLLEKNRRRRTHEDKRRISAGG